MHRSLGVLSDRAERRGRATSHLNIYRIRIMKKQKSFFLVISLTLLSVVLFMLLTGAIKFKGPRVYTGKCFAIIDLKAALQSGLFTRANAAQLAEDAVKLTSRDNTDIKEYNQPYLEHDSKDFYEAYSLSINAVQSRVRLVPCSEGKVDFKAGRKSTGLDPWSTQKDIARQRTDASVHAVNLLCCSQVILPGIENATVRDALFSYNRKFDNTLISKENPLGIPHIKSNERFQGDITANSVLCRILEANKIEILNRDLSPFKEIGLAKYFAAEKSMGEKYHFDTCAVVFSSSFLKDSGFGDEIDSHDAVLRFNDAPTSGFERDVGSKTTIRMVNVHAFLKHSEENYRNFKNVTVVIWRSGPYNGNLYPWYSDEVGSDTFSKYIAWKTLFPEHDVQILHPKSLWLLWDTLQYFTTGRLKDKPPSSGFTGVVLMLRLCQKIDIYGYKRSFYRSECHYYDTGFCVGTPWHNSVPEKDLIAAAHVGTKEDMDRGRVTLNGIDTVKGKCT
ncbi:beta-galactoside alpha-2,6-sialyltransferase 1-like [Ptychodera flava]|uniref:beta-galactoside alpha-2,6-sialyltransferase 1-like n=1 Tax=Ptychodera flava TaxID=63121 RepID=UPI00396A0A50